jgi:beta-galactosidase
VKRTLAQTDIKVYSNCQEVILKVNGKKVGRVQPDNIKVCVFKSISLRKGTNRIEVEARTKQGKKVTDSCEWILE